MLLARRNEQPQTLDVRDHPRVIFRATVVARSMVNAHNEVLKRGIFFDELDVKTHVRRLKWRDVAVMHF